MNEDQIEPEKQEPEDVVVQTEIEKGEVPKDSIIAGFWRRLFAFMIDGFIIGVPLITLGFVFSDIFYPLGPWGRIIGYGIVLIYFGYFNSDRSSEESWGKRILGLMVVDKSQNNLSIGKSFLRTLILVLILMLNGWAVPIFGNQVVAILVTVIVFGGSLTLLYGLIFNRTTRQPLHDLLVGSYVIRNRPGISIEIPDIPKIHKSITYGLLAAGLISPLLVFFAAQGVLSSLDVEDGDLEQLGVIQQAIWEDENYFGVGVQRNDRINGLTGDRSRSLDIEIWTGRVCSKPVSNCGQIIDDAAEIAFQEFSNIEQLDGMRISVINRFDLGLATGQAVIGDAKTIDDWKAKLELE
ncbi:MAG: RDD family protein [Anaerolineae bacterium]